MSEAIYLIWSNEHRGWWGPDRRGYVQRVSDAGRYSREDALSICTEAIPGTDARLGGMLPEIPVPLADVRWITAHHLARFPGLCPEWR